MPGPSERTRQWVLKAAADLGYQVDRILLGPTAPADTLAALDNKAPVIDVGHRPPSPAPASPSRAGCPWPATTTARCPS